MKRKNLKFHIKTIELIKALKIHVRAGETPEQANISGIGSHWQQYPAVYIKGTNTIWLNLSKAWQFRKCIDSVLLHEAGHALLDRYDNLGELPVRVEENMANAIALALHKEHKIPIHKEFSRGTGALARAKKTWPTLSMEKLK